MVEGEEAGPQLQQWEQKKGRGGLSPAPKSMASPSNRSSPPPTPNAGAGVSASANGSSPGPTPNAGAASSNGGPGRSLLGAFGNVSMWSGFLKAIASWVRMNQCQTLIRHFDAEHLTLRYLIWHMMCAGVWPQEPGSDRIGENILAAAAVFLRISRHYSALASFRDSLSLRFHWGPFYFHNHCIHIQFQIPRSFLIERLSLCFWRL